MFIKIGQLRRIISEEAEAVSTVKIKSVSVGPNPGEKRVRSWSGNEGEIRTALQLAGIAPEDQDAIIGGTKAVGERALRVLLKNKAVSPVSSVAQRPAPSVGPPPERKDRMSPEGAQFRIDWALKRFAKSFVDSTPNVEDPGLAAAGAIDRVFSEYPGFDRWLRIVGMSKAAAESLLANKIASAGDKARSRVAATASLGEPRRSSKETYKIYPGGRRWRGAPVVTRVKGKVYLAPGNTQFKPGEQAAVEPSDGRLRVRKPGGDHEQTWEPE